jgi:predicted transcriptional regulator
MTTPLITALAHPLRARMMQRMSAEGKGTSPKQLATEFELPLANVAYHITVLKKLKLIKLKTKVPRRGAVEHFYVLAEELSLLCPTCGRPMPQIEQETEETEQATEEVDDEHAVPSAGVPA